MSGHSGMWAFIGPTVDNLRDRLTTALHLEFEARYSEARGGDYWATPMTTFPDVGIYPNAKDEDGYIYMDPHPEVTALVDADELDDKQLRVIQFLGGRPIEEYRQSST